MAGCRYTLPTDGEVNQFLEAHGVAEKGTFPSRPCRVTIVALDLRRMLSDAGLFAWEKSRRKKCAEREGNSSQNDSDDEGRSGQKKAYRAQLSVRGKKVKVGYMRFWIFCHTTSNKNGFSWERVAREAFRVPKELASLAGTKLEDIFSKLEPLGLSYMLETGLKNRIARAHTEQQILAAQSAHGDEDSAKSEDSGDEDKSETASHEDIKPRKKAHSKQGAGSAPIDVSTSLFL